MCHTKVNKQELLACTFTIITMIMTFSIIIVDRHKIRFSYYKYSPEIVRI